MTLLCAIYMECHIRAGHTERGLKPATVPDPCLDVPLGLPGWPGHLPGIYYLICLLSSVPAAASKEGQQVDEEVDKVEIKVQSAYD